jgi:DNA-binding NarL/FixJ family response regulator
LRLLPRPLPFPDRVVLLTPNDPNHMRDAWEAGVSSVVTDQDPPNTVVLAILSACLRSGTADTQQVLGRKFD